MALFDLPANGYGTHVPPKMVICKVNWRDLRQTIKKAKELNINYQRWFLQDGKIVYHEKIFTGNIVYFPEYNCIRDARHFSEPELVSFDVFFNSLKRWNQ